MTWCDLACVVVHLRFYFTNSKACQEPDDFLLCPDMENHGLEIFSDFWTLLYAGIASAGNFSRGALGFFINSV